MPGLLRCRKETVPCSGQQRALALHHHLQCVVAAGGGRCRGAGRDEAAQGGVPPAGHEGGRKLGRPADCASLLSGACIELLHDMQASSRITDYPAQGSSTGHGHAYLTPPFSTILVSTLFLLTSSLQGIEVGDLPPEGEAAGDKAADAKPRVTCHVPPLVRAAEDVHKLAC